ncbi:MAG: DUF6443 domain-containing protein [Dysgonamonadaceae bacterium]|nr:DUF6443 domain-containing protein [Dysgonamonadaceae bacterium]
MKRYIILYLYLAWIFGIHAQTYQNPLNIGTKSASFTYSNTQNTSNLSNSYGRKTNEAVYTFTLSVPMEVVAKHCGSAFDTYMHLLDVSKNLIVSNDDYSGEGSCSNIYHSYIKRQLAAGTYYIVSEGYSGSGNITTTITGTIPQLIVDIGPKSAGFTYTDTKNTANTNNDYVGRYNTNDVFYKFTLSVPMEIVAKHCGSALSDTYMYLLDASKNLIVSNDDYSGEGSCSSIYHSYIKRQLAAGTYYIVSEGYSGSGNITTTITGTIIVSVTGVSLNTANLSMDVGATSHLTATVAPANATNKTVSWTSSNTAIATVSNTGLVTAKTGGTATITVTTADGARTASCSVTVIGKLSPVAAIPSSNQNYIKTRTYTSTNGAYYMDAVRYYDGLGRPNQTVQTGVTPSQSDLVALQTYDGFGREDKSYLPAIAADNRGAFVTDFTTKSSNTYNNTAYNLAADANPYSYPLYESSPLNRVLQQYGAGANWHNNGKSVKTDYLTNSTTYPCAYYYISGDNLVRSGNYGNSQLYVTGLTDEEGNISYEFKDKLDRVVLQRQMDGNTKHDTYYVYDDFGNLRYVLPPLAADGTGNGSYNENSTTIKNYAYVYKYDERNRCIWKQLPGCTPVYYVYDKADRLVFSQDGEQRTRNEWIFNKYDAFGRIILSGIYTSSKTQSQMAETFKNTLVVEYPTGGNYGYSWRVQPVVSPDKVLTVNHYDNYQHLLDQSSYFNNNLNYESKSGYGERYINSACAACSAKGLLVGTRVKLTDGSGEIVTAMYYDEKGRLVQKKSTNHLGGFDKEFYAYSFAGQTEKKEHVHTRQGTNITENYRYEYDHAERLTDTYYQLSGQPEYLLSRNTYDELGRLKTTTPYNLDNFKSTYGYDVRSLIHKIGSPNYAEDLTYKYNGNVETMQWQQVRVTRKYTFGYDGLSRLKTATYNNSLSEQYSTSYHYDKNGNIINLSRYGQSASGSYSLIDNLMLNYGGSNRLKYVNDAGRAVLLSTSHDFKNYSSGTDEYVYNANGSMTKDLDKGISEIAYNVLNLPLKVDIKSPVAEARNEYTYSADGQKLKVVHKWASSYSTTPVIGSTVNTSALNNTKTSDYVGNFIYENNALKKILTENGYYEGGIYYFYVKNHLGSNEMTVNGSGNIVQKNHYYPFGLTMGSSDNQGVQAYKYTGKELDMDHGLMLYDYGARSYDPAVGRFLTIDPLCEKYYSVSPYVYCNNNPINNIDPTGMDWYRHDETGAAIWQEGNNSFVTINDQIYDNIGETYSHAVGSTTYSYTQNDLTSITYTGITDNNWVSQIKNKTNCYQASLQMLKNDGVTTAGRGYEVIIVNRGENGSAGTGNDNFNTGVSIINNALGNGNPIIVGIDYKDGYSNVDGMTDHFIVVSSMTENINNGNVTRTTYNFFDPGTKHSTLGTSPNNRLSFSNNRITGTYIGKLTHPYTVVTIRRNK